MSDETLRYHRRSLRLQGYDYTSAGLYFVTICTHDRALLFDDPLLRAVAERQWHSLPNYGARGAYPGRVDVDTWIVMPDHVHAIIVINDASNDGDDDNTGVGAQQQPLSIEEGSTRQSAAAPPRQPSIEGGSTRQSAAAPPRQPSIEEEGTAAPPRQPSIEGGSTRQDVRSLGINVSPGSLGAIVRSYKAAVARQINRLRRMPNTPVWQRGYWERIIRDDQELHTTRAYIVDNPDRWHANRDNLNQLLVAMDAKE